MNTLPVEHRIFDLNCRHCPRLADFLDEVGVKYPRYHARPVPPFGDPEARLLIVGLAPGMHGANASGRPFTGDHAGILLYESLYKFGYSNKPQSVSLEDGLVLTNCRITNAVKCLPPQNNPLPLETRTCSHFLQAEISELPPGGVLLTLGGIAHRAVTRALGLRNAEYPFAKSAIFDLHNGRKLFSSYHPSRYNLHTGKITAESFAVVFAGIREVLS